MTQAVDTSRTQTLDLLRSASNLADAAFRRLEHAPNEGVVTEAQIEGELTPRNIDRGKRTALQISRQEFLTQASQVAHFLIAQGVQIGDRVVTLPSLRHEWVVIREGIRLAGAVHVAIFGQYPTDKIAHIMRDSEPKLVFLENEEQAAKFKQLITTRTIESTPLVAIEAVSSVEAVHFHALISDGQYESTLPRLSRPLHADDLADINYTSGTKGAPKGVMQTHGNHLANAAQVTESDVFSPGKRLFPLLRFPHSYCLRMVDMATVAGGELLLPAVTDRETTHISDRRVLSIQRDIIELGTEVLATAPAALERMYDKVCARWIARGWAKHAAAGHSVNRFGQYVLDKVRSKLFPDSLEYVISGGGRLPESLRLFFRALGVPIFNGYGATEGDVVVATNTPTRERPGTVGVALPGVGVEIVPRPTGEREIVVSGPQVSKGYWRLPEETAKSFRDGKYFTGDTGTLDADGFLCVEGRLDDVVKLENGEKVALEAVEERVKALCPSVARVVVCADGQLFCTAIVVVDQTAVAAKAIAHGISLTTPIPFNHPFVQGLVRFELASANAQLEEHHTRIRSFTIVAADVFSESVGTIGPTLKLVRPAVKRILASQIDRMAEEPESSRIPNSGSGLAPARITQARRSWLRWLSWRRAQQEPA